MMRLIQHSESGEVQCVLSIDGYGAEWLDRGDVPQDVPARLATWDGAEIVADLGRARAEIKGRVKVLRDAAETGGCTVPGIGRFDSDPDSQRKISGAVVMAMLGGAAFTMEWRLANNSVEALDAAQMIAVGVAVGQHVAACQQRKNEIDAALNAAGTYETLMAIDIEGGWAA